MGVYDSNQRFALRLGRCCEHLRQETWGPESPITNLTFGLQVGLELGDWFLNLGGRSVFLRVGTAESWQESDATIAPLHFFRTLDPYSSITSLGPKLHFWPTPPFNFGVSLTLNPTIDPPYIYILHVSRMNPTFIFFCLWIHCIQGCFSRY